MIEATGLHRELTWLYSTHSEQRISTLTDQSMKTPTQGGGDHRDYCLSLWTDVAILWGICLHVRLRVDGNNFFYIVEIAQLESVILYPGAGHSSRKTGLQSTRRSPSSIETKKAFRCFFMSKYSVEFWICEKSHEAVCWCRFIIRRPNSRIEKDSHIRCSKTLLSRSLRIGGPSQLGFLSQEHDIPQRISQVPCRVRYA